jgi:hypothetical protein
MISEYQKDQQNIPAYTDSAGNLLKYFPASSRFDVGAYQHYIPKDDAILGAPATEKDVENEEANMQMLVHDYNNVEKNIKLLLNKRDGQYLNIADLE